MLRLPNGWRDTHMRRKCAAAVIEMHCRAERHARALLGAIAGLAGGAIGGVILAPVALLPVIVGPPAGAALAQRRCVSRRAAPSSNRG